MVGYSRKYHFQKSFQVGLLQIEAAAIFGSCARGDSDQLSDRDLLLVGKDSKSLRKAASYVENLGWSCSTLTWSNLAREEKRKSLFVQHLKLEGIIIKDTQDRLRTFLHFSEPRCNYSWEVEQAKDLIGLVEYIPLNKWGSVWALDVLMVGFRSFGYAKLANEGMFNFSFNEVLNGLCKIGILKSSDTPLLKSLRKWKHSYRFKFGELSFLNQRALELISLIDKRINLGIHTKFIDSELFIEKQDSQIKNSDHWYRNSRSLEAVIRINPEKFDSALLGKLCSPQGYSFEIRKLNSTAIIEKALAA